MKLIFANLTRLAFLVASISTAQIASADTVMIHYRKILEEPDVKESITDLAGFLAVWNPSRSEQEYRRLLLERARETGTSTGLLQPALVLLDAAILSQRPEVASLLSPTITKLNPAVGAMIHAKLGLPGIASDRSRSVRAQAEQIIGRRLNFEKSTTALRLEKNLNRLDPSGIANSILGPRAFVHYSGRPRGGFGDDGIMVSRAENESRSPIFGMTSKEIMACASSCGGEAIEKSKKGRQIGAAQGEVIGAVTGFAVGSSGGVLGALGGAWTGSKVGHSAGGIVGGVVFALGAGGMCAANCGNSGADNGGITNPKSTNSGPSGTSTSSAPGSPSQAEPRPQTPRDPATSDPDNKPKPRTSAGGGDSMGGSPRAGGGDSCVHPCSTARVVDDPGSDDPQATDDTPSGIGGGNGGPTQTNDPQPSYGAAAPDLYKFKALPVINPVRPDLERTGFSRPDRNFRAN